MRNITELMTEKKGQLVTRNINNWAKSGKYEHFSIK